MSTMWSLAKKKKKHDERIAIMIDKAAGCLELTACKKNLIVASETQSITDDNLESTVAHAVSAFCQQHQLNSPACTIMLPASSYQMLLVEAPPVNEQELAEALQWKVKDLLNKTMEQCIIDGFLLPDDAYRGRQKMAYSVVVDREELQILANSLNSISVELDRIEVPELVLLSLLARYSNLPAATQQTLNKAEELVEKDLGIEKDLGREKDLEKDTENQMVVVIGRQRGFLAVVADAALYLSRSLELSECALQNNSNVFSNNSQIDSFILEMQRSRDYFESQVGKGTISRILLAPLNNDAEFVSNVIHERLGISVEPIHPSAITDFTLASKGAEALLLASAALAA